MTKRRNFEIRGDAVKHSITEDAKLVKRLKDENKDCSSCGYFLKRLKCRLKNTFVKPYNICHHWKNREEK